jgi:hypothetical protein
MNHVLHVSAASAKETDDGVVETITLTAVSINPGEMIPLVGEQVVLTTPGQKGRKFGGSLTLLSIKDGKHGPEVTVKVVGATELNSLVGTNVTVEAAQMELPVGPGDTYGESSVKQAIEAMRPKPGSGIDSVTISTPGTSVTLTAKPEETSAPVTTQYDLDNF